MAGYSVWILTMKDLEARVAAERGWGRGDAPDHRSEGCGRYAQNQVTRKGGLRATAEHSLWVPTTNDLGDG